MEIDELGSRLRSRRAAAGETIAAVAMRAGLSVPYIANLENGRGNPTLTALSALASALGATLRIELAEPGQAAASGPAAYPASLTRFARTARFATETRRLADRAGWPEASQRDRLLTAMAAAAAATPQDPGELGWHRVLDAIVLIGRGGLRGSSPRASTAKTGKPARCTREFRTA